MSERGPLDFGDAGEEPPRREDEPRRDAEPPREPPPPARPPGASRYGWFIGLVGFLLVVVVTLNTLSTDDEVPTGGPSAGNRLFPFAVPLADGDLDGDANLATEPGQGEFGERAACEVRGPDVLNICEEWELGPVVLTIFPASAPRCRRILEQFRRMRADFPGVRFVAVGSRGDREDLRGSWGFPVGWDRDGQVLARYGVVDCPQVTFALSGGQVVETVQGAIDDATFAANVRKIG
jgi:hypothetical protein